MAPHLLTTRHEAFKTQDAIYIVTAQLANKDFVEQGNQIFVGLCHTQALHL